MFFFGFGLRDRTGNDGYWVVLPTSRKFGRIPQKVPFLSSSGIAESWVLSYDNGFITAYITKQKSNAFIYSKVFWNLKSNSFQRCLDRRLNRFPVPWIFMFIHLNLLFWTSYEPWSLQADVAYAYIASACSVRRKALWAPIFGFAGVISSMIKLTRIRY